MENEKQDLERFLKNVDEISELVKELNSSDPECQKKASEKADKLICCLKENEESGESCNTRLNRTVINTNPPQAVTGPQGRQNDSEISTENFMKILEKDAEDRRKRRKENEKLANALKEMGNEAFAKGDYETAVLRYSEGLEKVRDMQVLYTNRAQAYIKLMKYQEAIGDCDWALRCNEKCIKAYIHMGRAHLALHNYKEARNCYHRILDIEPKRENIVHEYLNQVDLEEKKALQEQKARAEFEQGKENATSVLELLHKLGKPEQISLYYTGGICLLSEAIKDGTEQTLFRIHNGFSIINSNPIVRRSLSLKQPDRFNDDLCISVLNLWKVICEGNEENQKILIHSSGISENFVNLLASETPGIQMTCIRVLCIYSQTQYGRSLVLQILDLDKLVENLLKFINNKDITAKTAVGILDRFAGEQKFRVHFQGNFTTTFLPPFTSLLNNMPSVDLTVLPPCISMMASMTGDDIIRKKTASCQECWEAFLTAMDACAVSDQSSEAQDVLCALLGFMINISKDHTLAIEEKAIIITARCLKQLNSSDGGIITRTTGLLSNILPHSHAATEEAVQKGIVKKMITFLKAGGQTTTHFSIKTLAICTTASIQAREELVKLDKKLCTLVKLLRTGDEVVVGNAALSLGQCLEVPGAASSLLGSDIIMLLLKHAGGDASKTTVQRNTAIALGRLCTVEPGHLIELRKLHGLEILDSCMKYIK
ncbi:TTC12 protein, partial [Amia calva]|nr:TTC12 protein [Amia calva]